MTRGSTRSSASSAPPAAAWRCRCTGRCPGDRPGPERPDPGRPAGSRRSPSAAQGRRSGRSRAGSRGSLSHDAEPRRPDRGAPRRVLGGRPAPRLRRGARSGVLHAGPAGHPGHRRQRVRRHRPAGRRPRRGPRRRGRPPAQPDDSWPATARPAFGGTRRRSTCSCPTTRSTRRRRPGVGVSPSVPSTTSRCWPVRTSPCSRPSSPAPRTLSTHGDGRGRGHRRAAPAGDGGRPPRRRPPQRRLRRTGHRPAPE